MEKYIELLTEYDDNYEGHVILIEYEDSDNLYYNDEYGNLQLIKKELENITFEYTSPERWLDYVSPWDDDINDDYDSLSVDF